MRLLHLHLQASRPDEIGSFYADTLGLPVDRAGGCVTVTAGATRIAFAEAAAGSDPYYHFALNITESKMPQARAWLAARCPLLRDRDSGADQLRFDAWDADSIYFHDSAGNVVELIARHGAPTAVRPGPFGAADILCASEIGLALPDPAAAVPRIVETLGVPRYLGSSFALGDEQGLLILPEEGRPWIPERAKPARVFPARVAMEGPEPRRLSFAGLPYELLVI